jgi:hypothetical protein
MGWPNGTPAKAPFLLASWDVMLSTARHSEKSSREEKASTRVTLPECRHCLPGITRAWLGMAPAFFSSQKTESWPERGSPGVTDGAHHNQQDICCQHRRQHLVQRAYKDDCERSCLWRKRVYPSSRVQTGYRVSTQCGPRRPVSLFGQELESSAFSRHFYYSMSIKPLMDQLALLIRGGTLAPFTPLRTRTRPKHHHSLSQKL